jgi:DNA ligase-1
MTTGLLRALLLALAALASVGAQAAEPPPLMRATVYEGGIVVPDYWVSEKLDGVRGYWDGAQLLTRSGNRIAAPGWFTAGWPDTAMDGELWAGRGGFERASSIVRQLRADDRDWHALKFMVFDLPAHPGSFDQRLPALRAQVAALDLPWVQAVQQSRLRDENELQQRLEAIVAAGGEGLMLHRGAAHYVAGRSADLLKFKAVDDAEARVVGYSPGAGRYQGMLGALIVERPDGLQFRIGTGFSDEQRRAPPALGSWVTYGYSGLTSGGLPRFARFLRIRDDMMEE